MQYDSTDSPIAFSLQSKKLESYQSIIERFAQKAVRKRIFSPRIMRQNATLFILTKKQ
jgi:hypothetical protein